MTATYDPALVDRLVREAREDDAMLPGPPWSKTNDIQRVDVLSTLSTGEIVTVARVNITNDDGTDREHAIAYGIARVRNALPVMADQLEASRSLIASLYDAVRHTLNRAQTDPEFRWHMLHTETFDRLVRAEAAYKNRDEDVVRAEREIDRQPEYRRRLAECDLNRERVRQLELLLEEHGIAVPPREEPP